MTFLGALALTVSPDLVLSDDNANFDSEARPVTDGELTTGNQASPRVRVNRSFDKNSPPIGELIRDGAGFDSARNQLRLRNLRGQHTVLIFGSLT